MTATTPHPSFLTRIQAGLVLALLPALACDVDEFEPDEGPSALEAELDLLRQPASARLAQPSGLLEIGPIELDDLEPTEVELCVSENGETWCWQPEGVEPLETELAELERAELMLIKVCGIVDDMYCCWPLETEPGQPAEPVEGECVPIPSFGDNFFINGAVPPGGGSTKPSKPIIDDYAPREEATADPGRPSEFEGADSP